MKRLFVLIAFAVLMPVAGFSQAPSANSMPDASQGDSTSEVRTDEPPSTASPAPSTAAGQRASAMVLRWIDAKGRLYPGGKVTRMEWVWSRMEESDALESPALRLWISGGLPSNWVPEKVAGSGVSVIEPLKRGSGSFVVDLRSSRAALRFNFTDGEKRVTEMTLAIRLTLSKPYVMLRPECGTMDLRFMTRAAEGQNLFVGLSCLDVGDGFDVYFFRSRDTTWNRAPGLVQFDAENRFIAFKYHVNKPKVQTVYSQRLFSVGTVDEQGRRSEYAVFYNPRIKPKRFYSSAGIGTSYYSYQETNETETKVTQIGTTGKVNLGYRLVPRLLDIAFNGFATIVPITHSPGDVPSARFLGLNGRIGYRLPLDLGAMEFMFLTGWYYWSMNVADGSYGVSVLNGPQIFLTMVNSRSGKRGWWMYGKYALISNKFQVTSLNNRELALGGGIELSRTHAKPFSFTVDAAHTQFRDATFGVSMKLLSVTAGLQKSF